MRWLAALALMILSPLIAEYLLGSMSVAMLPILPVMMLMYGAGALLIREIVRRAGKGWPSLILLAAAYGFIEEGLVTQSLFNPNYMHLRLLDFGFVPALGTSPVWAIYVLGLHIVWSIATPIGLVECLFPARRKTPWLGPVSTGVAGLLFLAGLGLIAAFTYRSLPFMAAPPQIVGVLVIVAALIAAALAWPQPGPASAGKTPHPLVLCLVSFVPGSLFVATEYYGIHWLRTPWPGAVALMGGWALLALGLMVVLTRGRAWTDTQRFGLMAGAFAVYVWFGFPTDLALHGRADLPAHTILVAAMGVVAIVAGIKAIRFKDQPL